MKVNKKFRKGSWAQPFFFNLWVIKFIQYIVKGFFYIYQIIPIKEMLVATTKNSTITQESDEYSPIEFVPLLIDNYLHLYYVLVYSTFSQALRPSLLDV